MGVTSSDVPVFIFYLSELRSREVRMPIQSHMAGKEPSGEQDVALEGHSTQHPS